MPLTTGIQTEFFSYFKLDGNDVQYREQEQIWNYGGIAIKVQGIAYDGSYNGFGKRHLVQTKAGGKTQNIVAKARKLALRRSANPAQPRQKKLKQHPEMNGNYTAAVYGPQTGITTAILLDGYTRDDIARCFHDGIVAVEGLWANGTVKPIEVVFPGDIVYEFDTADPYRPEIYNAVAVDACKDGNIYHITHLRSAFMAG